MRATEPPKEEPQNGEGTGDSPIGRKEDSYFRRDRSPFLDWIGAIGSRVLEIGCGAGANAAFLRSKGASYLVGIELDPASAEAARDVFDVVVGGRVEDVLDGVGDGYDMILCADVLEHLEDPWRLLVRFRDVVAKDGVLAISIPNIRHYRALFRIAFGAGFEYESHGTFDSTHLRFFARRNIDVMLQRSGWSPIRWSGSRTGRIANALGHAPLIGTVLREWLTYQWYVVAIPTGLSRATGRG